MWLRAGNNILWIVFALLLASCGSREVQGPVRGKVTLAGNPLPAGVVVFSNNDRGVHVTAQVKPDGSYELQTANGFGLPLGKYRVAICAPLIEPTMPGAPPPLPVAQVDLPAKYTRPETSELTLTVVVGDNLFNIVME